MSFSLEYHNIVLIVQPPLASKEKHVESMTDKQKGMNGDVLTNSFLMNINLPPIRTKVFRLSFKKVSGTCGVSGDLKGAG